MGKGTNGCQLSVPVITYRVRNTISRYCRYLLHALLYVMNENQEGTDCTTYIAPLLIQAPSIVTYDYSFSVQIH